MVHFIEQCPKCGTIVNQCRCISKDKEVRRVLCTSCIREIVEKAQNWDTSNFTPKKDNK